jgi:nicotinate-nucleotide adenylyltransferase
MNPSPKPHKIGIFGGTFDPVHLGHIHLAGLAKDALGLDEIYFIPCRISPHKPGSKVTGGDDRYEMLRLATAALPWAVVDDLEIRQPGPSFSYRTAETFAARFPAAQLYWIMGSDQWDALPDWRNSERLAELVEFIVLARGSTPEPREGYRLHVVQGEHPASASAIRAAISRGETPAWLDPAVEKWISFRGPYQES